MKKKADFKSKAFFQLAQILATIAGFLLIASGLFSGVSQNAATVQTQYTGMLLAERALCNDVNNANSAYDCTVASYLGNYTDTLSEQMSRSGSLAATFFFSGILAIIFSIFAWGEGAGVYSKDVKDFFIGMKNDFMEHIRRGK